MREFESVSDETLKRLKQAVVRAVLYGAKLNKDTSGEEALLDELTEETYARHKAAVPA